MISTAAPTHIPTHIGEMVADEQLIGRTLQRAHRQAEAANAPSEARAVLHVAQRFADELEAADPGFDRVRFMKDVMDDLS